MRQGAGAKNVRWMSTPVRFSIVLTIAAVTLSGCGQRQAPVMNPVAEHFLRLGSIALDQYESDVALAYVDSALAVQPDLPDAYLLLGRIYGDIGLIEKSDSAYLKLAEINPDYPGVWNNLGNNSFRAQQYSKAITYYRREIDANPAPIPWRGIGRAYVELGKNDSAIVALEQSIRMDSLYAPGYFNLALIHDDAGDIEKALAFARKAAEIEPGDYNFKYLMASLLQRAGRSEEALPHLFDVAEHWPWHHASHYNLGQALLRLGYQEQGEAVLDKAEVLRAQDANLTQLMNTARGVPNDPIAQAAVGSAMRKAGRYDDALQAYKIALHLDPKNIDVHNNMAVLHLIRGDTLAAIRQYENLLQVEPAYIDGWLNLGVVYALSKRTHDARRAWNMALKADANNQTARKFLARLESEPH